MLLASVAVRWYRPKKSSKTVKSSSYPPDDDGQLFLVRTGSFINHDGEERWSVDGDQDLPKDMVSHYHQHLILVLRWCVYLFAGFCNQFKSSGLSSAHRRRSWTRFDSSLVSPQKARPWWARNLTLVRMMSSILRAFSFSALWAWLSSSPTLLEVFGRMMMASTASRWVFHSWCFWKAIVASFQLQ